MLLRLLWLLEQRLGEKRLSFACEVRSAEVQIFLNDVSVVEAELVADIVVDRVDNTKLISTSLSSLRVAYSILVVWGHFDAPLKSIKPSMIFVTNSKEKPPYLLYAV